MQKGEMQIYTNDKGVQIQVKMENDTIWLEANVIASLFNVNRPAIVKHIQNIYNSEELDPSSTCSILEQVAADGRNRKMNFYNLDVIIGAGYRVNSKQATHFRKWATARLREYLVKGFAINESRIAENQALFLKTIDDLKLLSASNQNINTSDMLELVKAFQHTWFSLDSYDKNAFPEKGTQSEIDFVAADLALALQTLKTELIKKGEATGLFAQEKRKGSLEGIFGNVFQSVFGEDAYPSVEEKAAHLLYFIIKNHPFNDGNKRSGAFAFIWFLQKVGLTFRNKIYPETLATLTILIAESSPDDKEKMIGVVLLMLNQKK